MKINELNDVIGLGNRIVYTFRLGRLEGRDLNKYLKAVLYTELLVYILYLVTQSFAVIFGDLHVRLTSLQSFAGHATHTGFSVLLLCGFVFYKCVCHCTEIKCV